MSTVHETGNLMRSGSVLLAAMETEHSPCESAAFTSLSPEHCPSSYRA
jgi:hypothetical protein